MIRPLVSLILMLLLSGCVRLKGRNSDCKWISETGRRHGVIAQEAFRSFGERSIAADLLTIVPFPILYVWAGDYLIRRLLLRYAPNEGAVTCVLALGLASILSGVGGVLLGQEWSNVAESIRVGSGHLSNRIFRLPIYQHPLPALRLRSLFFWARPAFAPGAILYS